MKFTFSLSISFVLLLTPFMNGQSDAESYVRRFAKVAIAEKKQFRIPASITLAQGMLESGNGKSELAERSNNHFGIKCTKAWTGERVYHDDDFKGECFRKYESPWWSFRDHSKFLQKERYAFLKQYDVTDYKSWAYGLKKAGYATNPKYPQLLIKRIEEYKLWQFDKMSTGDVDAQLDRALAAGFGNRTAPVTSPPLTPEKPQIKQPPIEVPMQPEILFGSSHTVRHHPTGNLPYIVAQRGDTWDKLAAEFDLKIKRLTDYNDVALDRPVLAGQNVFLKAKKSRAKTKTHRVQAGENMYIISQKYGVKLSKLYEKNLMRIGEQPKTGELIYLKKKKKSSN